MPTYEQVLERIPFGMLEKAYTRRKQQMDQVQGKRQEVVQMLAQLDKTLSTLRLGPAKRRQEQPATVAVPQFDQPAGVISRQRRTPSRKGTGSRSTVTRQKNQGRPMRDFIFDVLQSEGGPLQAAEVARRIGIAGYNTSSTPGIFRSSVASCMRKDPGFRSVGRGVYEITPNALATSSRAVSGVTGG